MAFLDNSGDIILDAVLTDLGRQRMARGDFNIRKFAFGDEEINYTTFNPLHPSGSSFADIEIMQTPILEAFTNNMSLMKSKLVTMSRNNILYLPLFRLNADTTQNQALAGHGPLQSGTHTTLDNGFLMIADLNTRTFSAADTAAAPGNVGAIPADNFNTVNGASKHGVLFGDLSNADGANASARSLNTRRIVVDQGLDTAGFPGVNVAIPEDLKESSYMIRMDHRLLRLSSGLHDAAPPRPVFPDNRFVDDDSIASYYVNSQAFVQDIGVIPIDDADPRNVAARNRQKFNGPLGKRLSFTLRSSLHIQQDNSLYNELGGTISSTAGLGEANTLYQGQVATAWKYIDTVVSIVGVTTGYSIDIPIRIIKR